MGDVKHDWEYTGGRRGDEDEWRAPGRSEKNWSVEQRRGPVVRSCQQLSLPSQRGKENKEGTDEDKSKEQGASNKVRWLSYRCIVQHVFDKLPQKGKNKQSCTV